MIRVPVLTTHGVDALLATCNAGKDELAPPWDEPTCDSIYEHAMALGEGIFSEDISKHTQHTTCLLYTSPSPRDRQKSRMPSSA